jgi:hypothetical protein
MYESFLNVKTVIMIAGINAEPYVRFDAFTSAGGFESESIISIGVIALDESTSRVRAFFLSTGTGSSIQT